MLNRKAVAVAFGATLLLGLASQRVEAEPINGQLAIAVELEIDAAQLEQFKAAIKENAETAVKVEPGCLAFNAVFEKDNPSHVRLFEIYANADAFKSHLDTPHFKKFMDATKDIVKSRKRVENLPITLNVKAR
jgi:quinol monooxygenase YgiN